MPDRINAFSISHMSLVWKTVGEVIDTIINRPDYINRSRFFVKGISQATAGWRKCMLRTGRVPDRINAFSISHMSLVWKTVGEVINTIINWPDYINRSQFLVKGISTVTAGWRKCRLRTGRVPDRVNEISISHMSLVWKTVGEVINTIVNRSDYINRSRFLVKGVSAATAGWRSVA